MILLGMKSDLIVENEEEHQRNGLQKSVSTENGKDCQPHVTKKMVGCGWMDDTV